MRTYAQFESLLGGLKGLVVLLAVALLATPTQATTIVFSDDFQDDAISSNPGTPNIGLPWSNELSPGVTVVANPDSTGNTSTQVLQLHNKGEMNGNFAGGILCCAFDGARLSTDFYIGSAVAANKITMKFRTAAETGPFNLNLKANGVVTGGSSVGALSITHYGTDVWQNVTWGFDYTGAGTLWDVDVSFTNLDTGHTTSSTTTDLSLAMTTADLFTHVAPKGQAGGNMYVDNIQVSAVPEPSTGLLLTLGLTALSFRRRHTPRP